MKEIVLLEGHNRAGKFFSYASRPDLVKEYMFAKSLAPSSELVAYLSSLTGLSQNEVFRLLDRTALYEKELQSLKDPSSFKDCLLKKGFISGFYFYLYKKPWSADEKEKQERAAFLRATNPFRSLSALAKLLPAVPEKKSLKDFLKENSLHSRETLKYEFFD